LVTHRRYGPGLGGPHADLSPNGESTVRILRQRTGGALEHFRGKAPTLQHRGARGRAGGRIHLRTRVDSFQGSHRADEGGVGHSANDLSPPTRTHHDDESQRVNREHSRHRSARLLGAATHVKRRPLRRGIS